MRGMRRRLWFIPAVIGILAGCGSLPTSIPGLGGPPSLASEQRRLAGLFAGTPVVFAMQADGSLRAEVPLRYSFDARRSAVKPPLGKVLDHIAGSQAERETLLSIYAPGDEVGAAQARLARERAASTRDYLVARGISVTRFTGMMAAEGEAVRILISEAPH